MDPSVLFSGLRFDRKKLGANAVRFQEGKRKRKSEAQDGGNGRNAESESQLPLGSVPGTSGPRSVADLSSVAGNPVSVTEKEEATRLRKSKRKVSGDSSTESSALRKADGASVNIFRPLPIADLSLPDPDDISQKLSVSQVKRKAAARVAEEIGALRKKFRLHVAGQSVPPPLTGFEQLESQYGCEYVLLRRLSEAGYVEPTPIQRQAIPVLLEQRECLACAPTGSGKTLAFMLPIIMKLAESSSARIRAVILCPVRELAAQIAREFRRFVSGKKLRVRVLTSSLSKKADFSKLPCDILISTPLRLEHLVKDEKMDLGGVEYLVLDESDKLFEMGFVQQIDSIVAACTNPKVVHALFSATLPDTVEELARTIMDDAIRIIVGEKNSAVSTVEQRLLYVGSEDGKLLALRQLFETSLRPPILIFVDSKERAKQLHTELAFEDVRVDSIHADRTQEQRNAAVEKFRAGTTWVLLATDLMARGMDFKGVNCVINYDFPQTITTYIHRIGRSGRAGRSGEAVTFYTEKDVPYLRSIAHVIRGAGCEVPEWMLSLRKIKVKKGKKTRRGPIG